MDICTDKLTEAIPKVSNDRWLRDQKSNNSDEPIWKKLKLFDPFKWIKGDYRGLNIFQKTSKFPICM